MSLSHKEHVAECAKHIISVGRLIDEGVACGIICDVEKFRAGVTPQHMVNQYNLDHQTSVSIEEALDALTWL